MNPEEGELRPQILDRFPLCVKVESVMDPKKRVEIVKRNILYESNPQKFLGVFEKENRALKGVIVKARQLLPVVEMEEVYLYAIAEACSGLKVDGQRPDIVIVKTSQTIAAVDQRKEIHVDDILLAAEFTLSHRTRDGGLLEPATLDEIRKAFTRSLEKASEIKEKYERQRRFSGSTIEIDKADDGFIEVTDEKVDELDTVTLENIEKKKKR